MSVLENIKEKIDESKSILMIAHENPDGDAIASALALYNAFQKLEKKSAVYIPSPDKTYSFLAGFDEMLIGETAPDAKNFDLCISLDSSDIQRLGICGDIFKEIDDTICIDHHITNQNFADINYINAVASSTCENLMVVLASLGVAVNKEIAECLYTGILTDTGGFRYNITPETMEIVATIMETGINVSKIYRTVFDITSFNKVKLVGRAIDRLELLNDGKIAFTYMTKQDLEELELDENDSDGIVNEGRNIDSVEVSIFAKERDEDYYKISMRANEYVDVSVIASKYAGGGHVRAAGCELNMTLDQIKTTLCEEIAKQLK
jgi:phosphoesterase RecJ-like protein